MQIALLNPRNASDMLHMSDGFHQVRGIRLVI